MDIVKKSGDTVMNALISFNFYFYILYLGRVTTLFFWHFPLKSYTFPTNYEKLISNYRYRKPDQRSILMKNRVISNILLIFIDNFTQQYAYDDCSLLHKIFLILEGYLTHHLLSAITINHKDFSIFEGSRMNHFLAIAI